MLLDTMKHLRDLGNTLLVVEHDEDTMRAADYIVDIGPGAGVHGGEVVAAGTAEEVMNTPGSITGDYLSGRKKIPVPAERRKGSGNFLTIRGAAENNLRDVDVSIPPGHLHLRHRRVRLRQVLPGQRNPLQAAGRRPEPGQDPAWKARGHRGGGVPGQGHRH